MAMTAGKVAGIPQDYNSPDYFGMDSSGAPQDFKDSAAPMLPGNLPPGFLGKESRNYNVDSYSAPNKAPLAPDYGYFSSGFSKWEM